MMSHYGWLLLAGLGVVYSLSIEDSRLPTNNEALSLRLDMLGSVPYQTTVNDQYMCREFNFEFEHDVFVNRFEPLVNGKLVHHALLVQCLDNSLEDRSDYSRERGNELYKCGIMFAEATREEDEHLICGDSSGDYKIIYVWAHHASSLSLPSNLSFALGSSPRLVLQLHYTEPLLVTDEPSAVLVHYSYTPTPATLNVFALFADQGVIPARSSVRFELFCRINEDVRLKAIAYRIHGHDIAQMGLAFLVKMQETANADGGQWILIGRRSIQDPQIFAPVRKNLPIIETGDYLAAMCIMNNPHDYDIHVGHAQKDEMCNLYLMYHMLNNPNSNNSIDGMQSKACVSSGPPFSLGFRSNPDLNSTKIPYKAFH